MTANGEEQPQMNVNERKCRTRYVAASRGRFAFNYVHLPLPVPRLRILALDEGVAGRSGWLHSVSAAFAAIWLTLVGMPHADCGDWPTHRGNPQRTGAADDQPGPQAPKVLWVHKTREHFIAAPVPGGKEVYLPSLGAFNTSRFDALTVTSFSTPIPMTLK